MLTADYDTVTSARAHLGDVFRRAQMSSAVTVRRDGELYAVIATEPFRRFLTQGISAAVKVYQENGEVVALMEGQPFVSTGGTLDEAIDDLILSLREYQEDWEDHLSSAPNHALRWNLVQLVKVSTDEQLRAWLDPQP